MDLGAQVQCGQARCEALAIFTFLWPGQEKRSPVCLVCATRATSVAGTLGYHLDIRPIDGATLGGQPAAPSLRLLLEVN